MKNYVNLIAFDEGANLNQAIEILKANGFECEETTCYSAALKQEICENLENCNLNINDKNMEKVLDILEEDDEIWESLEEAVRNIVDDDIFAVEAE